MKDPAADPDVVGYCGVLLTSHNEYQGFLLTRQAEDIGRKTLVNARRVIEQQRSAVASRVDKPTAGVSSEDQPLVGTLASALVDCWMTGKPLHVASAAAALRLLIKQDFFWIMASSKPEGVETTIYPLDAKTPVEARAAFEHQPPVMMVSALRRLKT